MTHHLQDHDNDDIERELYQLGLTDIPPPPPPALRGAVQWPPPSASSARSRSAPSIQEDSLQDPPVPPHNPRPPPAAYNPQGFNPGHHHHHHHHNPQQQQQQQQQPPQQQPPHHRPPSLTQHNPLATHSTAISHVGGGVRMGLWAAERPPMHHSLTDLATDNPGGSHNYHIPARTTTPGISLYNGGLSNTALVTTAGEDSVTTSGITLSDFHPGNPAPHFTVTSGEATTAVGAGVTWTQDPGAVHYPGYVLPNDFRTLPRGPPRELSPEPEEEDEERLQALVSSVEAALRRIHAGLQESYIMYENPDDEEDPPPPQPVTASLRDPPPSPVPPHERPVSPPPPAGPEEPLTPSPSDELGVGGVVSGAPRLVGPDNASRLSRELGFIPIQEGAPQPPQPPPRHSEHHKHHHLHKLSKKVKNHKSKVLLSGLMGCPGPGFKLLNITRDSKAGQGFGFSIKGGREAGIGVYVSRVEQGGPAWRAGLRPGDLLLAANNTNFSSVTHAEAINLLKSSEEVTLTVATTSQLPTSVVVAQTYSWVTPDGRPTSPPPEYNPRLHHHQVQRVEVEVVGSESLGLMIRGGVEYGLGIFITGVDPDSAAHKAGLQIGDQILEVNAESFLAVTHDTAVNVLKYSRRLRLAIRRVAKVPHSCTTYDRRCWPTSTQSNGETSAENMEATLAMIEEKSQRVLTRQQHAHLREVVGDYAAGRIPIEHLLIITRDLLDSPDKMSLLTELREVVRLEDQDKFDAAVFRHEPIPQEKTDAYGGQVSNLDDFIDMYNQMEMHHDGMALGDGEEVLRNDQRVAEVGLGIREIPKTPSEDSGVEMSNGAMIHRRDVARSRGDRKRSGILIRENETSIEGVTWADTEMELRMNDEEFEMDREREERENMGSKREKVLQKRYSERILPKTEDVIHKIKPQRRHSHTGELNGATGGMPLLKSHHAPHTSSHHPHSQRSAHSHSRKQYEGYDKPTLRSHDDYNLPSTRVRDDYEPPAAAVAAPPPPPSSASRGREDYDPPSRGREDYESSRVRGEDYATSVSSSAAAARMRDEYKSMPSSRPSRGEDYDPMAGRGVSGKDYDVPPVLVRDEYLQQSSHSHEDYGEGPGSNAYDMATLSKVHGDYGALPQSAREVYEGGSPSRSHLKVDHRPGCGSGGGNSPSSPAGVVVGGGGGVVGVGAVVAGLGGGRRGSSDKQEDTHPPYSCRSRRTSLVVSDSLGRFRVVVKKTRPNLGIAIEGGADTKQKLPRVINIAANGAAFEAGGLRVGQLIIAVDGQKLDGHSHEEAARLIAACWVSRSRPEVEFMVVERKQTAADVRRSSISLLSQM